MSNMPLFPKSYMCDILSNMLHIVIYQQFTQFLPSVLLYALIDHFMCGFMVIHNLTLQFCYIKTSVLLALYNTNDSI
jgi:hypothetical protein